MVNDAHVDPRGGQHQCSLGGYLDDQSGPRWRRRPLLLLSDPARRRGDEDLCSGAFVQDCVSARVKGCLAAGDQRELAAGAYLELNLGADSAGCTGDQNDPSCVCLGIVVPLGINGRIDTLV
jgi:hypothetical protein